MFQGFTDKTFEFFMAIRFNNNREFFLDNRDWYLEHVRGPLLALAEALESSVEALDPALERRANKVVSRINRDVRFSNDKSPYRDYMWLGFRKPGAEKHSALGAYMDMSDTGARYGMGFYGQNMPLMNAHRAQLNADAGEFIEIARAATAGFTMHGDVIKRMAAPEFLPEDIRPWYPLRGFYMQKTLDDFALLKSPALADEIAAGFAQLKPLYGYFARLTPVKALEK